MDSLQLIDLVRTINASLSDRQIEPREVYHHPSIEKLAIALRSASSPIRDNDDDIDTWIQMQQKFRDITSTTPSADHSS